MASGSLTRLRGRPRRADGLGLRRAMPDRLLPALVAAMSFLAALALAGAVGAAVLAERWRGGAAALATVQVPDGAAPVAAGTGPVGTRLDAVLSRLRADPAVVSATAVDPERLRALLAPWLGGGPQSDDAPGLDLPSVVQARLRPGAVPPPGLDAALDAVAPGTLVERNPAWTARLVALSTSLQACAVLALLVVAGVAASVVAAATRAGLAARRQAIEIVHGLGAGDGYIAARFARRTTGLAFSGSVLGTALSIPLLLLLCRLSAPFAGGTMAAIADAAPAPAPPGIAAWLAGALSRVPLPLWVALPLLPPIAACIGWLTAQATVRAWLRRLP